MPRSPQPEQLKFGERQILRLMVGDQRVDSGCLGNSPEPCERCHVRFLVRGAGGRAQASEHSDDMVLSAIGRRKDHRNRTSRVTWGDIKGDRGVTDREPLPVLDVHASLEATDSLPIGLGRHGLGRVRILQVRGTIDVIAMRVCEDHVFDIGRVEPNLGQPPAI